MILFHQTTFLPGLPAQSFKADVWKAVTAHLDANNQNIASYMEKKYATVEQREAYASQLDTYLQGFFDPCDQFLAGKHEKQSQVVPGDTVAVMYLTLSQLNFRTNCSLKGEAKTCDVTDKIGHFLSDGFSSDLDPVVLRFLAPNQAPGSAMANFSVNFQQGASRCLAAHLLAEVGMTHSYTANTLTAAEKKLMKSLLYITCSYPHADSISKLVSDTVLLKQRGAERQRLDVVQLVNAFTYSAEEMHAKEPAKTIEQCIQQAILNYNKRTHVKNCKIDGDERMAVQNLCNLGPEVVAIIKECWNSFKVCESPLTIQMLATNWLCKKIPDTLCSLWAEWAKPTKEKMPYFFKRITIAFSGKVMKENAANGKTVLLRTSVGKFREKTSDELLFVCCCWASWQAELQSNMDPRRWADVQFMFYRGTLDEVIARLMRANDPNFKVLCFLFTCD